MEIEEIETKIMEQVGEVVNFQEREGTLKDRVVNHSWSNPNGNEHFFDVIDLIHFPDWYEEEGKEVIRFGYYVYRDGNLRWGRMALTESQEVLVTLFEKASARPWFRKFLKAILVSILIS